VRKTAESCDADLAGPAGPARTASPCPVPRSTLPMTTSSASRCALSATTTPARCCSTPAPLSCGAVSLSPFQGAGPPGWAYQQGARRAGPALLRQGRRIPAARGRPFPRRHPPRRPYRTSNRPTRLGDGRSAHSRHRPGRPHRQPRNPCRSWSGRPDLDLGAGNTTPARSPPPET